MFFHNYSLSFFGFCLMWAVGRSNIGQKNGGRLNQILLASKPILRGSLASPSRQQKKSKNSPKSKSIVLMNTSLISIIISPRKHTNPGCSKLERNMSISKKTNVTKMWNTCGHNVKLISTHVLHSKYTRRGTFEA